MIEQHYIILLWLTLVRWWYGGEKEQNINKIKLFISKTIKVTRRGYHNYFFILDWAFLFCLSGAFIISLRIFTANITVTCAFLDN